MGVLFFSREMPRGGVLGAPQASGIEKVGVDAVGTSSGCRKCVKVKLIKSGKEVLAIVPGDGKLDYIDENDTVVLENCSKLDIPNVKCRVIKVASVPLKHIDSPKRTRG